jgi:membrane fusion protein, multidrug efflux system
MKNTKYIIPVLVSSLIFMGSCGEKKDDKAALKSELESVRKEISALQVKEKELMSKLGTEQATNVKMVETNTISLKTFESGLILEGTVDASKSTIATSKVPGTVMMVNVEVGQNVSAGQVLAQLDNSQLLKSKMELEQQVSFAKTVFEKQERLWKQGVGTEIQYLSSKNQKEALEKSLNTLNNTIDMYNIKSPINGTIEAVDLKVGQVAAPGMPYFKVVNMSDMKVVANVSEGYSGKVSVGDKVKVSFPDLGEEVSARLSFASNFIDPMNRTFKVETKLGGIKNVKPNMIAKLSITDYIKNNAIAVPSNVIQKTDRESFVMLVTTKNNKTVAEKRIITTGKNNGSESEILSGLNAGDVLITNGFQELIDGQSIEVNNPVSSK